MDKTTLKSGCNIVFVVYQEETQHALQLLEQELTSQNTQLMLITCKLPPSFTNDDVAQQLSEMSSSWNIEVVLVLSDTSVLVTKILTTVAKETRFKWTSLKHTTEWIVVSRYESLMDSLREEPADGIDFMTLIYESKSDHMTVVQKSRRQDFHEVLVVDPEDVRCIDVFVSRLKDAFKKSSDSEMDACCQMDYFGQLRKSALHFLKSQKSSLEGLVLPVAVIPTIEDKFYTYVIKENRTVYDGYSIALLDTLANSMGFTYTLVAVDDGSYYGDVMDNGDVFGITGQLARREAALTTLPLSITETRRTKIEYILTPTVVENINIIYRIPTQKDHLDLTYLDIIQPEFFLYLIGPIIVVGVIGAVIHVLTNSCYSPGPEEFKKDNLRLLASFPDHICFHTERTYRVQSGLILRTSWALFWFIISSAYSAYLVTTFTVKPPELAFKTFKQLMEHPEFSLGMNRHDTALQTFLRLSQDNVLHQVWMKLLQQNKTDSSTFSPDSNHHSNRVLKGGYALIAQSALNMFPDYPDVRTYPQRGFESINHAYIGIPQNTFYFMDLSNVLRSLEESGILDKLKSTYLSTQTSNAPSSKVSSNDSVTLFRIQLPVYFALCGMALGLLSLATELILYKLLHRTYNVSQSMKAVDI
ncbi:ionotropic receptor [Biomphalaria glabrata]|nr:glutamate receptor-like [Biomphalaria glabrata]